MADHLLPVPLTERTVHLCVDMQRIFSSEGPWATPWMGKVLPVIVAIAERFPERTVFTRFITPQTPADMPGMWRCYYEHWLDATRARLDPRMLELVPPLARLVPPATVIDKSRYSGFFGRALLDHLLARGTDGLVVTGAETDVCVLATVLGAVDHGFRVIVVRDAICSSSDEGHDALLQVYHRRFSLQIETADAEAVLSRWT
jgi:nicotinamidase-related amidase